MAQSNRVPGEVIDNFAYRKFGANRRSSTPAGQHFSFVWGHGLDDLRLNVTEPIEPSVEISLQITNCFSDFDIRRRIRIAAHARLTQPAFGHADVVGGLRVLKWGVIFEAGE